jgi:hypothetical protein
MIRINRCEHQHYLKESFMSHNVSSSSLSISRLILVPALITLAVTLLRLAGELLHWSNFLFNRDAGGGGAVIGISWLAPVFGIYFAIKLCDAGEGPASAVRSIVYSVLSLILMIVGGIVAVSSLFSFPGKELVGLALLIASVIFPFRVWSKLSKVLLAYALAARIPVAILMFFAIRGQWGTHYDVLPPGFPPNTGFWETYIQIGLIPQLTIWIAFTIITGMIAGSITAAIKQRGRQIVQPA